MGVTHSFRGSFPVHPLTRLEGLLVTHSNLQIRISVSKVTNTLALPITSQSTIIS
jgi:hypothetical protein